MIGADALQAAAMGHACGLGNTPESFDLRVRFLGAEPEEVKAVARALEKWRRPDLNCDSKRVAYVAGFLDGFTLALAAALIESFDG